MTIMNKIVMIYEGSAATWTTSQDVLDSDPFAQTLKQQPIPRVLTRIGFAGGAAALNTVLSIKVGIETVAQIRHLNTTDLDISADTMELNVPVPPNEQLSATISAQSGTNGFLVYLEFDDHPAAKMAMLAQAEQRGRYAGGGYRRRY